MPVSVARSLVIIAKSCGNDLLQDSARFYSFRRENRSRR